MARAINAPRPLQLDLLNAVCLLGIGVLIGLAWSEWWPQPGLGSRLASACEPPVIASHRTP